MIFPNLLVIIKPIKQNVICIFRKIVKSKIFHSCISIFHATSHNVNKYVQFLLYTPVNTEQSYRTARFQVCEQFQPIHWKSRFKRMTRSRIGHPWFGRDPWRSFACHVVAAAQLTVWEVLWELCCAWNISWTVRECYTVLYIKMILELWTCIFSALFFYVHGAKLPEPEVKIEVLYKPFLCHRKSKYGDILLVHYEGFLETNGTMFHSRWHLMNHLMHVHTLQIQALLTEPCPFAMRMHWLTVRMCFFTFFKLKQ